MYARSIPVFICENIVTENIIAENIAALSVYFNINVWWQTNKPLPTPPAPRLIVMGTSLDVTLPLPANGLPAIRSTIQGVGLMDAHLGQPRRMVGSFAAPGPSSSAVR
jgi:hypothetical protein